MTDVNVTLDFHNIDVIVICHATVIILFKFQENVSQIAITMATFETKRQWFNKV